MSKREIYSNIRKIYLRHMIWPIVPIITAIVLLIFEPFKAVLAPVVVNSMGEAIEAVEAGNKYIEIRVPRLLYSGYNYMRDTDVYGEYYYELVDDKKCIFVLLKPSNGEMGASSKYDVVKRVKFKETNGIFDNMLTMFADTVGWTEEGVKGITEPYILSEVDYHYNYHLVLLMLTLAMLIYGVISFIYNLVIAIFPELSPKLIGAKLLYNDDSIHGIRGLVELIGKEIGEAKVECGKMYITEHFFINMGKMGLAIVPLNRIILAYEHSTLKSFFGIHLNVTYTLYLKCTKFLRFHAPRKTKDEVNSILDYFRENEPDILIGYSDENKQLVKQVTKSNN